MWNIKRLHDFGLNFSNMYWTWEFQIAAIIVFLLGLAIGYIPTFLKRKKQYDTAVEILVQGGDESGQDFAERISDRCFALTELDCIDVNIQFTTSSNGRQTANLTFQELRN